MEIKYLCDNCGEELEIVRTQTNIWSTTVEVIVLPCTCNKEENDVTQLTEIINDLKDDLYDLKEENSGLKDTIYELESELSDYLI